ncbi:MAG: hypothetical protein ACI9SC_003166 [Gammaproteobacteria bacterium]|jgi:hypothetical protein
MTTSLYTPETAKWYYLLNQAQADTRYYLGTDVERYIADMLFRFSCDAVGVLEYPKGGSNLEWNLAKEERLIRVQGAGERCLVTAGFFPEHANYAGLSLLHFIDKGRSAYNDLAEALPGVSIYADINDNFVQLVDVLQKIGELSGVCRPIDLIQACELWQQERSKYGWFMIQSKTDAFPASTASLVSH